MSVWVDKLVTKEDPFHVHKTLGILCLLSFVIRLLQVGPADVGFARFPAWTVPTLFLHFVLSLSSFEFKIPSKRIDSGYRIWPEYRLHSFVFTLRSLALMLAYYVEERNGWEPNYDINLIIVLLTMAAADYSSWLEREHQSGFARELDVSAYTKFFFSFMQFAATSSCIYGLRRYTSQFLFVVVVQGNAFLMTLRRKNLASHYFLIGIYGFMLVFGLLVGSYEHTVHAQGLTTMRINGLMVLIATLLRTGPRLPVLRYIQDNKYIMWLLLGLMCRTLRPMVEPRNATPQHSANEKHIMVALRFLLPAFCVLIWYKGHVAAAKKKAAQKEQ